MRLSLVLRHALRLCGSSAGDTGRELVADANALLRGRVLFRLVLTVLQPAVASVLLAVLRVNALIDRESSRLRLRLLQVARPSRNLVLRRSLDRSPLLRNRLLSLEPGHLLGPLLVLYIVKLVLALYA